MPDRKTRVIKGERRLLFHGPPGEAFGPMFVDQQIRDAIMQCWMALPPTSRSVENVEKQILRLVRRAIRDLREDAAAFGFAGEAKP